MLQVEIDPKSGFCFGVVRAIRMAERELAQHGELLCLGDIVHNGEEVERLTRMGLRTIPHDALITAQGRALLLRAHGEPPSTYQIARQVGHHVVDATCPVVLQLQRNVKAAGQRMIAAGGQIMIYGKPDHAEVIGLMGQTQCPRFVVLEESDLDQLRYDCPTECFSQTTMSPQRYAELTDLLRARMLRTLTPPPPLVVHSTTCSQVSNRQAEIARFAQDHDLILFVSGRKSSNGQMLYRYCCKVNQQSHFISHPDEIDPSWLAPDQNVGICGATSTPRWLMEQVAERVRLLALQASF